MSNFSFYKANFLNTTTLITVDSRTSTVANLFDRDKSTQYKSVGKNNETSGHTIGVEFAASRNINTIVLQNINLKGFRVYHSSNSANTLTLTSTSDTTTSLWTGNSSTSLVLQFATVAATSIFIDATTTIAGTGDEKEIGELWCLERKLEMSRNPSANQFKAKLDRQEFVHELSGGGWASYIVDEYYTADIKLSYWDKTQTASLLDIYDDRSEFVFMPFPTATGWDVSWYEDIKECIWIKGFDFKQPQANNFVTGDVGFKGSIRLRETPR